MPELMDAPVAAPAPASVGSAVPSATSGILIAPTGVFILESSYLTAGCAVAIFGATTAQRFTCKVA